MMITKQVKIIGAVVIVLIVAGLVYFAVVANQKPGQKTSDLNGEFAPVNQTPEAAEATQKLISDLTKKNDLSAQPVTTTTATGAKEINIVTVAPGSNSINIKTGEVVTTSGAPVNNAAQASSPEAPQESFAVDKADLPASTIKLDVTSSSFTPKEFTVSRGQAVSLSVSNVNTSTFSEVFRFDDPLLSGVVIGLAKGETKAITFNAPTKAGQYVFYSSMFNHRDMGAVGTMIVK